MAGLGIEHGFWGCVADGATFETLGRWRALPEGEELVVAWPPTGPPRAGTRRP